MVILLICRCRPAPPWCPCNRPLSLGGYCVHQIRLRFLCFLWIVVIHGPCCEGSFELPWMPFERSMLGQIRHHCQDYWPHSPACIRTILINDWYALCTYALCSSWHYTVDKKSHSAIQLTFEHWPIYQQLPQFYRYSLFKPSEDPISHLLPSADDCCSDGQQLCSLVIHTRVCNLSSLLVTMIFAVLLPSLLMITIMLAVSLPAMAMMMLVAIVNLLISSFQSSPLPFLDCRVAIYIQ